MKNIPTEILIIIFNILSISDLTRIIYINKHFNNIINNIIEKRFKNMVEVNHTDKKNYKYRLNIYEQINYDLDNIYILFKNIINELTFNNKLKKNIIRICYYNKSKGNETYINSGINNSIEKSFKKIKKVTDIYKSILIDNVLLIKHIDIVE